ncbi:hypothetical protein EW146_g3060 [Bondarzewia mesenterica]|uniref:Class E vacuolar protein-sorting machinery protein HSE1 n=1 Tax=Bondarzewia mesenterica TaxID=1095465 RepID=A0A4S4LYX5_9AGAM|nr:hypothetical protein EW146_g3060 [Bondarzewia mesenterica]
MFKSGSNPYDDIVVKTTDENLTSENWELIMNLCDKVQDEGEQGARNVIAAILKRLAHRNPNVQLYSLALVEALSKNCTIELHREIASRAFTQALEKLITDRMTHDKVRRKALSLIAMWVAEFEHDPTLGVMEDCYNDYSFEAPQETPPPDVDDEVRRREEEELQRALEISVKDKGGRAVWNQYSLASSAGQGSSSGAGSSSGGYQPSAASSSNVRQGSVSGANYADGYTPAPARTSTPPQTQPQVSTTTAPAPVAVSVSPAPSTTAVVTRVRALHTFEPTEAGELAFDKGDIIKVVDRGYKDWWRGQLKGRTGIFPVNYVEPLPEPTATELAAEAQQEATVFAQSANVDKLLTMLRSLDPAKDNLADNEEIQELYRSSMALRPKIVKLIDKYSQKRADLVAMNESFVKARTIFDRMMEESLARHSGFYDQRPSYIQLQSSFQARPDSRATQSYGRVPEPQAYGWNPTVYDQPGYNAYPAPADAYSPGQEGTYPLQHGVQPQTQSQPQPQQLYADPSATPHGASIGQQQPASVGYPQQPYPAQHRQSYMPEHTPVPSTYTPVQAQQPQPQPQAQVQPSPQPEPAAQQTDLQPQPQPQQSQQQQLPPQGPPYTYDPNANYADPNVHAWAQYYAQGGTDPTGSVYFFSVPGITDKAPAPAATENHLAQTQTLQDDTAGYQHQQPYGQAQEWTSHQQQLPPSGAPAAVPETAVSQLSPSPQSAHTQTAFIHAIQQQQHQQQHIPSAEALQRQDSVGSLPSPGSYTVVQSPQGPYSAQSPQAHGPAYAAAQNPTSPVGGGPGAEWAGAYYGLQNQFAGMNVGGGAPPPGTVPQGGPEHALPQVPAEHGQQQSHAQSPVQQGVGA